MKFTVLSLFPEIIKPFFEVSIMKKSVDRGIIGYNLVNIRDFSKNKHKKCDDIPYGGSIGMVLGPEPLALALDSVNSSNKKTIFLSPSGVRYNQELAYNLSKENELVIICGRYEGIDQRIIDFYVDLEISIGDYVISSGEVAFLVLVDSIYRLLNGTISKASLLEESFTKNNKLLEYPHYTRPFEFRGLRVPDVLISGNHERIKEWRFKKSVEKTKKNRYDLYLEYLKSTGEKKWN